MLCGRSSDQSQQSLRVSRRRAACCDSDSDSPSEGNLIKNMEIAGNCDHLGAAIRNQCRRRSWRRPRVRRRNYGQQLCETTRLFGMCLSKEIACELRCRTWRTGTVWLTGVETRRTFPEIVGTGVQWERQCYLLRIRWNKGEKGEDHSMGKINFIFIFLNYFPAAPPSWAWGVRIHLTRTWTMIWYPCRDIQWPVCRIGRTGRRGELRCLLRLGVTRRTMIRQV